MTADEARDLLAASAGDDFPAVLPPSVLSKLTIEDVPEDTRLEIGTVKDAITHLEWSGCLFRDGDQIIGEADYTWTRKYWYAAIGMEQYLDLVRRAVEIRQKVHNDIELTNFEDDGAFIQLTFEVTTDEKNLRAAYDFIRHVCNELEETAERASDEVGKELASIAARLSGWGNKDLDALVNAVDTAATTDDKGRSLEELCSRLFEGVAGFTVTGRLRTATEEIDISILNDSNEPRFRRESAIILAECKNWIAKCGKDEFVIFREKMENRNRRCTLGFLVSWNGFTTTVTKEMLRGSHEQTLIVPITGKEIRHAVRTEDFDTVLLECWDRAVNL
jgi:hypothetical protein